jgi:translocator assembly and maintenance protein 41
MELQKIVEKYKPDFAFAHGSGVFREDGCPDKPMTDLIFGVDSTSDWHKNNLKENPEDYSFAARKLGENFIEKLQKKGAGVYYNAYVDFEGEKIKYGVISIDDLARDLEEWTHLYVAGRLHKPAEILKPNGRLEKSIKKNLEHALNVALLLLPENFSENELYRTIAGISYLGESRIKFKENSEKIKQIVSQNFKKFREMYGWIFSSNDKISISDKNLYCVTAPVFSLEVYRKLPDNLKSITPSPVFSSNEEFQKALKNSIAKIVHNSSVAQALKGFFSCGLFKH